jgi:hypothetical protein
MTEHIKTLELSPPTCTLHYFRSVYVRDDTLKVTTSIITLEGEVGGDAGKYGYLINRGFTFKNPQFISISILTCINYLQDTEFVEYEKGGGERLSIKEINHSPTA